MPEDNFSMDDFEKGLMLSGLIMPSGLQEIEELETLEKHEKVEKETAKKLHFKRVVLAAEIVSKLYDEPTLGHVKFQKLVYLCECATDMELAYRYQKQVAGPFDNRFMHSIDAEFKRLKWFLAAKDAQHGYFRIRYSPMERANGYQKYYGAYFKEQDSRIQFVIELFRKKTTDDTELAATLHACVMELAKENSNIFKQELIALFYAWSDKKKRFSEGDIMNSLSWMQENHLIEFEVR